MVRKDIAERISEFGFVMVGGTPAEFTALKGEETKHWKEIVAKSGASIE